MTSPPHGVQPKIAELRQMLDQELDRQVRRTQGCWPLVVAIAGALLGLLLLLRGL